MNIYLIHGDNNLASYERLQEYVNKAKNKGWNVIIIENNDQNIIDVIRSDTLFNIKKMIVIRKYALINNDILQYLNNEKDGMEFIIYHDNTIPVNFLNKLRNVKKNEEFRLSKYLWKFIENFYPKNVKNCLFYFHESLISDPVELIFSILVGQLKDLYLILYSENPLPYPSWRVQKLKRQADFFGKEKIKMAIDSLSDIDIKVKTSSANLKDELDLFIVRKLE